MQIFTDRTVLSEQCDGRYIFIDNDFLSELFKSEELLIQFVDLLPDAILLIDPYVEIEFRRDVYLPQQRRLKLDFVNLELFSPVLEHQEIYRKVKSNVLLLSQVYAHQNEHGASFVDLNVAARLMQTPYASLIITGNRKDYPQCIFDNVAILNIEGKNGTVKPYYFIKFNTAKFNMCYKKFNELSLKK